MTSPPYEFDDATRLTQSGENRWEGRIVAGWDVGGVAHGGYLLATALNARSDSIPHADPIAVSGHFLAPGRSGPIEVTTSPLKVGRTTAADTLNIAQEGRLLLAMVVAYGDLSAATEPELTNEAPDLPDPDDCIAPDASMWVPDVVRKLDFRVPHSHAGFAVGQPSGRAEVAGWVRFADGRPHDAAALAFFADSFPPSIFNAGLPIGWAPTLEMTIYFRKRPADGWLRAVFRTGHLSGGYLEEDGEVWDSAGYLVAQSRQLALAPRPF